MPKRKAARPQPKPRAKTPAGKRTTPAAKRKATRQARPAPAKGKAARKTRKASVQARPAPPPLRAARSVAVGDVVTAFSGAGPALPRPGAPPGREIRGIVCGIREVATGKPVQKTRGELQKYVLEILHELTFDRDYSSPRNIGAAGARSESQGWLRVQEMVRQAAARAPEPRPAAALLAEEGFRSLLDGWRLVRVKAELVVSEEQSRRPRAH